MDDFDFETAFETLEASNQENKLVLESNVQENAPKTVREILKKAEKQVNSLTMGMTKQREEKEKEGKKYSVWKEKRSGLHICGKEIEEDELAIKLEGYDVVKFEQISAKVERNAAKWAIIGVLAQKGDPKRTAKGDMYGLWTLTDLCGHLINVFVFGKAFTEMKIYGEKSVFIVANCKILLKEDKNGTKSSRNGFSLSASEPFQFFYLGQSVDFAICGAKSKEGKPCTQIVNQSKCKFCKFHVQKQYIDAKSDRPGLHHHAGVGGKEISIVATPTNQNFSCILFCNDFVLSEGPAKIISKAVPLKTATTSEFNHLSSRSMALVSIATKSNNASIKDLKNTEKGKIVWVDSKPVSTLGCKEGAVLIETCAKNDNDVSNDELIVEFEDDVVNEIKSKVPKLDICESTKVNPVAKTRTNSNDANKTKNITLPSHVPPALKESVKRFDSCVKLSNIVKDEGVEKNKIENEKPVFCKLEATNKVFRNNVNLVADQQFRIYDPNNIQDGSDLDQARYIALQGTSQSNHQSSNVNTNFKAPLNVNRTVSTKSRGAKTSIAIDKKRKMEMAFGPSINLSSEEGKKVLAARSAHEDLANALEDSIVAAKMDVLENKEQMAEFMIGIHEIEVKAYFCSECATGILEKKPPICVQNGHNLIEVKAKKKFFECSSCKSKTTTLLKFPNAACKKCGGNTFNKSNMYKGKEISGTLATELKVRGTEHAFSLRSEF